MPPTGQQIERDTAGEFATIRRANITANAHTIVTDSKKPDPLKSIKLIRSEDIGKMDFSKLSLKKIPLLTSFNKRMDETPPVSEKPAKLPRLAKFGDNSTVSSLQNTSPKKSIKSTPEKKKKKKLLNIPLIRFDPQKSPERAVDKPLRLIKIEDPVPEIPERSTRSTRTSTKAVVEVSDDEDDDEEIHVSEDDSDPEFFDAMDVDDSDEVLEVTPLPEAVVDISMSITPVAEPKEKTKPLVKEKFKLKTKEKTKEKNQEETPVVLVRQEEINALQSKLLPKLNGKSLEEPYCINDKIFELEKLLKSVIIQGQSHSCVVFGPRNSGKTAAFQSALRRIREEEEKDFIYININGMVQDTDTLAVRAIADQLDTEIMRMYNIKVKELEVGELLSRKSITNTFANVLKVLDDEITMSGEEEGKLRHPIVFCIDEVDVYAQQNRQTLLYNLFDLAENSKTPICVVCFTSKFTFKELLEKRVRSRFSQRTITFRRLTLERFLDTCAKLILVDEPENDYEREWNRDLLELVQDRSSVLRKAMLYNHLSQANVKEFQNQCVFPIAKLSISEPRLNESYMMKYTQNQASSSFVRLVNSLSDLESFLLVCAARVIAKTDMSWVNLNIVYEEYCLQLQQQQREVTSSTGSGAVATTGFKKWSKESCKHPWETLRDIGFLSLPGAGIMKSEFANSTYETRMWQVELTLDELRRIVYTAKPVKTWTRL